MKFRKRNSKSSTFRALEALEDRRLMSAAALTYGQIQAGDITSPLESDVLTFTASANDRIQIVTREGAGTLWAPHFELKDPSGHILGTWNGGSSFRSSPASPLGQNGVYQLTVTDLFSDGTGHYSVGLEGLHPLSPNPIALAKGGLTATQSITDPIDVKQYVFNVSAGDKIQLAAMQGPGTNWMPHFELFNPAGDSIDSWNGNTVRGYAQELADNGPGQYMLQVSDLFNDGTGTFTIGYEGISPVSPGPISLVSGGITPAQNINNPIEFKQYVFNAAAGDIVQIATAPGVGTNWLPHVELFSPDGVSLDRWNGGDVRRIGLDAAGQYMIQVNDLFNDGTGAFRLGLETIKPPSADAITLSDNVTVTATTTDPFQFDQYRFTPAGSSVQLAAATKTGTLFTGHFELYDAAGNQIDSWNGGINGAVTGLTPGAKYMLQVCDLFNDGTGTYSLLAKGLKQSNTAPRIASLSASPATVFSGTPITLSANAVADAENNVSKVLFYRESNGVAGLQASGATPDVLIGTDTSSAGGWTATFSTTGLSPRAYTCYAKAIDAPGASSNIVTATATVQAPSNSPVAGLLVTDSSAAETLFGTTGSSASVVVYRTGNKTRPLTMVLQLSGTATYGVDYTIKVNGALSSSFNATTKRLTLTLAANVTAAEVLFTATNDALKESNESIGLSLLSSKDYGIDSARAAANLTLIDRPAV
jgi:hypothetical protein